MRKKHVLQMTVQDITFLKRLVIDSKKFKDSPHAKTRSLQKNIPALEKHLQSLIESRKFEIIEYKEIQFKDNRFDIRVVIRGNLSLYKDVVYVLSLTNKNIVTVWVNNSKDKHETLDLSLYDENLKIF